MNMKKTILVTAVILIVAAVIYITIYFLIPQKKAEALKLSGQSGYNVVWTLNTTAYKVPITAKIDMYVKSMEKKDDKVILYFLVHKVEYDVFEPKIYNAIIPVTMAKNGNILNVEYPLRLEKEYSDVLSKKSSNIPLKRLFDYIIYGLEPVINNNLTHYENITYTKNGYIKSSYKIKHSHICKSRIFIEENNMPYDIDLSEIFINLSNSFWIKNAAFHEIIKDNALNQKVESTISINQIPYDNTMDSFFEKPYDVLSSEYKKENFSFYDMQRNSQAEKKKYSAKTKEKLNAEFNNAFLKLNNNSNESYNNMKKLLEENPYLISQVPDKVKSEGKNNNDANRMVIGILEKIGSADAQSALSTIMKDKDIIETNRIRAIVALNGVEKPSDHTVDTLINQAAIRDNKDDNIIANTSLLALGSAGYKLMDKTDKYNEIQAYFENALNNDSINRRTTLLSIGNTADKYFYNKVSPYLKDNNPENRAAAVYAVSSINMNEFMGNVESFLQNEKENSVRAEVYSAFALSRHPTEQMTNIIKENFYKESKQSQTNMITYLKNNINKPTSAALLEEILNSNTLSPNESMEVRKLLRTR